MVRKSKTPEQVTKSEEPALPTTKSEGTMNDDASLPPSYRGLKTPIRIVNEPGTGYIIGGARPMKPPDEPSGG